MQQKRTVLQTGFTMVELLVVIVIIGVLAAIAAPIISDGQKMADSAAYKDAASRLATGWKFVTQKCNVSNHFDTSPITTTATAPAHTTLLVEGTGIDTAKYQGCWNSAKIEPLQQSLVRGAAGAYTVNGSLMTVTNVVPTGTANRIAVQFDGVDDATVLELVQKYGSQAGAAALSSLLAAGDTTDKTIRYGVPGTNNTRTVTIIE